MRRNQEFTFDHVKFELLIRYLNGDSGSIKVDIGCFSSEHNREIKLKILIWRSMAMYGISVPFPPPQPQCDLKDRILWVLILGKKEKVKNTPPWRRHASPDDEDKKGIKDSNVQWAEMALS